MKSIYITDLFGIYNHNIQLWPTERITILHGPNGSGKTTILKMVHALKEKEFSIFLRTPFTKFRAEFDEITICVEKSNEDTITISSDEPNDKPFIVEDHTEDEMNFIRNVRRISARGAERIGSRRWKLKDTAYSYQAICELFGLPYIVQLEIPEWYTMSPLSRQRFSVC